MGLAPGTFTCWHLAPKENQARHRGSGPCPSELPAQCLHFHWGVNQPRRPRRPTLAKRHRMVLLNSSPDDTVRSANSIMRTQHLGKSELVTPRLAYGCWRLGGSEGCE